MKTGVLTLPLAAVLALLGIALATDDQNTVCQNRTPKITVDAKGYWFNGEPLYRKSYGNDIILQCSSNATKLEIKENGKSVQVQQVNETTVQGIVKKPNVGHYFYSCVDSEGCKDSLTVVIAVALIVTSTKVHRKNEGLYSTYFVLKEAEYAVYCQSHDASSLVIRNYLKELPTRTINDTTIVHWTQAEKEKDQTYFCSGTQRRVNGELDKIDVYPMDNPEAQQFECYIYGWRLLECSWNYYNNHTLPIRYELVYTDHSSDEDTILLCAGAVSNQTNTCKWDIRVTVLEHFSVNHNVTFLLRTCSDVFCNNQSYQMKTDSMIQAAPVLDFWNVNSTSHSVYLVWGWANNPGFYSNTSVYKVEYRTTELGEEWQEANLSSVIFRAGIGDCSYTLALPYADMEYEVRVSARLKDAIDKRLWSAPRSRIVRTHPRNDTVCDKSLRTQPTASTESIETCACASSKDLIKENSELRKIIKSDLKDTKNKLKKISSILTKYKDIIDELNSLVN